MSSFEEGEGDDAAPPVQQRGDLRLQELSGPGQAGVVLAEHHLPHLGVHVVQHDDRRVALPAGRRRACRSSTRRARRGAHAAGELGGDGPGEHQVATRLAHDPVAVAHDGLRLALGVARAEGDLEAGLGPQPGHVGGVDLAAAGLDVGEVAPREQVDVAEARTGGQIADLGDGIVVAQDRHLRTHE